MTPIQAPPQESPWYQDTEGVWRDRATNQPYVPPTAPPAPPYAPQLPSMAAAAVPPPLPAGDVGARLAGMVPGAVAMLPPEGQAIVAQAQGGAPAASPGAVLATAAAAVLSAPPPLPETPPAPPAEAARKSRGRAQTVSLDGPLGEAVKALITAANAIGVKVRVEMEPKE